ncbi:SIR2 family protein [Cocleimonas flava]|uniref:SIR2-like protein n=1 Tax=Cocleimonas flava TaxID=634765 RepID=A0A4R1F336_9GAMM|nr:SIR2 family protein [Cocleimonas flava]TCJ84801.1 SIR2-like protein [Cocleimonas flava]
MSLNTYDPREHIRGFHQILISDKKRIGFLFGAGTSLATNVSAAWIPAIAEMTTKIVDKVEAESVDFATAINEMKVEIGDTLFNIESLLSMIEAKRAVIGSGVLNGLSAERFKDLATFVKLEVVELVSVHNLLPDKDISKLAHSNLSSWISKARRRYPAEIFTTNYDYLFEIALENSGEPYFDGFSGSYEPFFCPEAVEDIEAYPHLVKLWKMHGSLGWTYRERDKAVVRNKESSDEDILIYPSHLKYNTSKKQPYVGLIDRLCTFLQQDDAVLITCGYSFGDKHINERIATSLRRGANSHVIAMYYDKVIDKDGKAVFELADTTNALQEMAIHGTGGKMSVYGLRHAVIGGKLGEWRLRGEPKIEDLIRVSQYFDEDGAIPLEETGEHKGGERWEGTGEFCLPDFCKLTEFLNDLSSSDTETVK